MNVERLDRVVDCDRFNQFPGQLLLAEACVRLTACSNEETNALVLKEIGETILKGKGEDHGESGSVKRWLEIRDCERNGICVVRTVTNVDALGGMGKSNKEGGRLDKLTAAQSERRDCCEKRMAPCAGRFAPLASSGHHNEQTATAAGDERNSSSHG